MQKVLFYLIKQKHLSNKIILFAILVVVFSEIKSKILLLCAVKFILSIQGTTFDAIKISWNFYFTKRFTGSEKEIRKFWQSLPLSQGWAEINCY